MPGRPRVTTVLLNLRQAFASWDIPMNPFWGHSLPMPSHLQIPWVVPILVGEYVINDTPKAGPLSMTGLEAMYMTCLIRLGFTRLRRADYNPKEKYQEKILLCLPCISLDRFSHTNIRSFYS